MNYEGVTLTPDPEELRWRLKGEQATIDVARAKIRKIGKQMAFDQRVAELSRGDLNPNAYDVGSRQFQSKRRLAFLTKLNPASNISMHILHGEYGKAGGAFALETAIWSGLGAGGELVKTGRVTARLGFSPARVSNAMKGVAKTGYGTATAGGRSIIRASRATVKSGKEVYEAMLYGQQPSLRALRFTGWTVSEFGSSSAYMAQRGAFGWAEVSGSALSVGYTAYENRRFLIRKLLNE